MPKFATNEYKAIKARELVEELYINDVGIIESFEKKLKGTTYMPEFESLIAFIQHFANGGNPGKKIKFLKNNDGSTEFEFISKHLRIYATQEPNKKILMFCGKKKAADSHDNIEEFRRIKRKYLKSIEII